MFLSSIVDKSIDFRLWISYAITVMRKETKKVDRPLKPTHEKFAREYVENGGNAVRAVLDTNPNVTTYKSASATASRLLDNTRILERIVNIDTEIEDTLVDIMRYNRTKRNRLAFETASYLHDKRHGKAVQRSQSVSTHVEITLDLSGS
jgi:hypothetical protein